MIGAGEEFGRLNKRDPHDRALLERGDVTQIRAASKTKEPVEGSRR